MKRQSRILAGTAIGLFIASAPLGAMPLSFHIPGNLPDPASKPVFALAQVDCAEGESAEDCAARQPQEQPAPPAEQPAPPAEQPAAPAEEPAPPPEVQPQPEPAPQPEAAPAQEAPAEQPAPQPAPQPEAAPQAEPAPEPQVAPEQVQPEQPAAEQPATEQAPERKKRREKPQAPDASQTAPEAPASEQQPTAPAETLAPAAEEPAQSGEAVPEQQADPQAGPNDAPILDSQKEEPAPEQGKKPSREGGKQRGQQGEQAAEPLAPVDQGPPPATDAAATEAAQPARVEAVREEKGKRRDRALDDKDRLRRERPEGVDVLREIGDRIILQLGGQTIVESNDRPRMTRGARDVYYEDLPRGRVRETILRDNGVQIVTIRNRNGDIIRRSRITPDGREYVLVYVDDDNFDRVREWRDPGLDLPPMRLNIPRNRYILESENVQGPDDYYDFLEQPPVEQVQRLYSVDEVKRSARVRDIARRVDLDTLTFEFGSASIPESEITKLEGVAQAMERLLDKNPAETFLIEGHTDAVGSDVANLALSDRRAESVAEALTNVFGIPPENLATQGYGERYLKVKTNGPERENRRVAMRRITPLVAPVASAN
ncbi:MAG: OmpA family protein [Hyphomicrobiales bacterium]|nr:OmpA family protein [Hyphomicrobiales bacterium]